MFISFKNEADSSLNEDISAIFSDDAPHAVRVALDKLRQCEDHYLEDDLKASLTNAVSLNY